MAKKPATPAKRTAFATVTWNGLIVTWTLRNGHKYSIDCAKLTPELRQAGLMNGIEQKGRDVYALPTTDVGGKLVKPTDAEKETALKELVERLNSGGSWNADRRGTGMGSLLWQAVQLSPLGAKFADQEAFETWSREQAAEQGITLKQWGEAIQNSQMVKPHYQKLIKARTKDIEADAILAKFAGGTPPKEPATPATPSSEPADTPQ